MQNFKYYLNCGFVNHHPIRWCPNCGQVLVPSSGDYYKLSQEFSERTGWEWCKSHFDPKTGEVWPPKK